MNCRREGRFNPSLCFSEIFLLTKFITLSVIVSPILMLVPLWKSQFDDALQPLLQTG